MAERGRETLRHGPMKPVGLTNPRNPTVKPYAIVQLRQDNALGTLYNMVGFQTKLKHAEQVAVFRTIPGLEHAEFARLGGLHRNTFLNSPRLLDPTLRLKAMPRLRFAGPDHGLRGLCGERRRRPDGRADGRGRTPGRGFEPPPATTAIGALLNHITGGHIETIDAGPPSFQPMNVNFGLFPPLETAPRSEDGKKLRGPEKAQANKRAMSLRAAGTWKSGFGPDEALPVESVRVQIRRPLPIQRRNARCRRSAPACGTAKMLRRRSASMSHSCPTRASSIVQRAPGPWPGGQTGDVILMRFYPRRAELSGAERRLAGPIRNRGFHLGQLRRPGRGRSALGRTDGGWRHRDQCGWLRDRWGVPWQIVPEILPRLLADPDPGVASRVFTAMTRHGEAGCRRHSSAPPRAETGLAGGARSPHIQRDAGLVGHAALVPRRIEHHVDLGARDARNAARPRSRPSPASRPRPGSPAPSGSCRWRRSGCRRCRSCRSARVRRCRPGFRGRRRSSAPPRCRRSAGRALRAGSPSRSDRPAGSAGALGRRGSRSSDMATSFRRTALRPCSRASARASTSARVLYSANEARQVEVTPKRCQQRHGAMGAGPHRDAGAVDHRGDVVRHARPPSRTTRSRPLPGAVPKMRSELIAPEPLVRVGASGPPRAPGCGRGRSRACSRARRRARSPGRSAACRPRSDAAARCR